ncbi:hypothetical protein ABZP36_008763 [Zizania latifolia]
MLMEDEEYVHPLVRTFLELISEEQTAETRQHGLKILLQLLRFRWKEKSAGLPNKLSWKGATATLVAEIAWSHGVSLVHDLILCLVSLSSEDATEAELVCFILGLISNVGIAYDGHFKGGQVEMRLLVLAEFLPQILPLLCSLLDKHAQAVFSEQSNQHFELANEHECTVKAAFGAAQAYAEWVPLSYLAKYGLIQRCGSLLCSNLFRSHALEFLKSLRQRKIPVGMALADYDVAMSNVFHVLMNIRGDTLKFNEPELVCVKALCHSLGYQADVHAKAVDKLLEHLASTPAACQDDSGVLVCIGDHSTVLNEHAGPQKLDMGKGMGCYLVEEHNILSEAFTFVAACAWINKDTGLLSSILIRMSKIWRQSEWETNLLDFFCDAQFRTSIYNVVAFFDDELKMCMTKKTKGIRKKGKLNYSTLTTFVPLVLPPIMKLLQHVHSLWTDEVASNVSEELEGAKLITCSVEPYGCMEETTEYMDEEELSENEIRKWLEKIRQTGYNVIGMCTHLEGAFHELLDSTFVCGALMKDLESMEFRHLSLLIKYTVIPLVKKCPTELWTKWIDMLLQPVFEYCDDTLFGSWCSLLYKDTVLVPDNFCDASFSKERVEKLGKDLLFELTREASALLAVMALPEFNIGKANEHQSNISTVATPAELESINSSTLVGYLLHHDGLRASVLRLISDIFGNWKDCCEARIRAVPFCRSLILLATATQDKELMSFVEDDIIPKIVQCLNLEPNSDILYLLCEEAYCCMQSKGLVGEGECNENTAEIFDDWLLKQKIVARFKNESSDELEEFVWIWEIEEEFTAYIGAYIEVLHKVDEIGDSTEDCCSNAPFDFESTIDDPMSYMLSRKMSSVHYKRECEQKDKFFCKLITFKPYIKCSGYDESVQELLEDDSEDWSPLHEFSRHSALEFFCSILDFWEPQFHPLIREGHKDMLIEVFHQFTYREYIDFVQPLQPEPWDFLPHLQPYAHNYIEVKNTSSGYNRAKEQTRLHEAFDEYLASDALDHYVRQTSSSKDDFVTVILDDDILPSQFSGLDHDLLKMSLERRAKLLHEQDLLCLYNKHMHSVVVNVQLRDRLCSLICELEAEGFFCVDDDSIEWEKKHFSELVDKFNKDVFAGLHLPKYYVIRGIMDYWEMVSLCKKDSTWEHAFRVVVGGPYCMWMHSFDLIWMWTRYYKHLYYDIIEDPTKMIWSTGE